MIDKIEQELRAAFPELSAYFNHVFAWLKSTNQFNIIKTMSLQLNQTERAVTYSFLFGQTTAQIKEGASVDAPGKVLVRLWEYLLQKLVEYKYFGPERVKEHREKMAPYLKIAAVEHWSDDN